MSDCFVENSLERHFERAKDESRNLFLNRFLHFASLRDASVEMTEVLFYRAMSDKISHVFDDTAQVVYCQKQYG